LRIKLVRGAIVAGKALDRSKVARWITKKQRAYIQALSSTNDTRTKLYQNRTAYFHHGLALALAWISGPSTTQFRFTSRTVMGGGAKPISSHRN